MKNFAILFLTILTISCSNSEKDYEISADNLMKTVSYLASEKLNGRLSGSKEYFEAANFMANEFQQLGLNTFSEGSYFQKLNVEYNQVLAGTKVNLFNDGNLKKEYKIGNDYVFRGFTGTGNINAPVVFAGYGISIPEYNDYKNIDVKDKIVLVFRYNPKWEKGETKWPSSLPREKARVAQKYGAIGIMFVSLPNDENPQKIIGSVMHGKTEQVNIPQVHIDLPVAYDFFADSKYSLKELQTKIDSKKSPTSLGLKSSAEIIVKTEYVKEKETVNIIGIYPGTDEKLKDEFVILGAHLDHVGSQGEQIFFPGANDNASGSAAVLEIARMCANSELETKRSVMFVFFSNEESGLEGASHLANNLGIDSTKVIAMLNMDCVAHGDSIRLGSGKSSPKLWQLAKSIDKSNSKLSVESTWAGGGADATPFHNKGIPTLYFVTTNSYTHLHCLTDTPETLNPNLYEEITKLAYLTTSKIANGEYQREELKN